MWILTLVLTFGGPGSSRAMTSVVAEYNSEQVCKIALAANKNNLSDRVDVMMATCTKK